MGNKVSRVRDAFAETERYLKAHMKKDSKSPETAYWGQRLEEDKASDAQRLTELVREYIDDLSDWDFNILKHQISSKGKALNQYLRGNRRKIPNLPDSITPDEYTERLDELIRQAPRVNKDLKVFRGEKSSPGHSGLDSLKKAYISTTLSPRVASTFNSFDNYEDLLEILIQSGNPGLYIPDLKDLRHVRGEKEILLPRGSSFEEKGDQLKYEPPYQRGGLASLANY
jgi:hypothetical protein